MALFSKVNEQSVLACADDTWSLMQVGRACINNWFESDITLRAMLVVG
ncbi:hypothetical protein Nizo2029_0232 [Lactiplantibacillus plantarum]|nr:hypothetical protein Nizo2029_0232 [Lactiplantibacillus plantarum]